MASNGKRIISVELVREVDESPDCSHLGEWTDFPHDWAIVRALGCYVAQLGDDVIPERGREMRFFLPYAGGETEGSADYQKYGLQDWERMEALERGGWEYIGIAARAQIVLAGVVQVVRSGGLWGIESNGAAEYIAEVERNELAALRDVLAECGFSARAISAAFKAARAVAHG